MIRRHPSHHGVLVIEVKVVDVADIDVAVAERERQGTSPTRFEDIQCWYANGLVGDRVFGEECNARRGLTGPHRVIHEVRVSIIIFKALTGQLIPV